MSSWGSWGLHEALHRADGGEFYANEYNEHEPQHPDGPEGFWHGTPSGDLRGAHYGLHVGTYKAASEALNARIGKPAEGYWDGTRVYGETPVVSPGAGYGLGPPGDPNRVENPYDAHLPNGKAVFSDGTPIPLHFKPAILPVRIKGPMANTPHEPYEDDEANDLMTEHLNQGRTRHGFYYTNDGEGGYLHPKTGKWLTSISAVVPSGDHLEVLDPNWPGHHTASTDGIRYAAANHLMVPVEHLLPHSMYDLVAATDADYFPDLVHDLKHNGPKMPVTMETDGHLGLLADGTHRLAAAREAGLTHLPVRFLRESTRNLSRWGGEPLHDSIRQHLADNPGIIQGSYERQPSWQQGERDGIRYAHVVEADVAEDLRRLAMPRPKRIKPPWSDFHNGQAYPLQNQSTADLIHMFYSLRDAHRAGDPPADGVTPFADRIPHYEAELLDRHEAGDPEATRWADRGAYIKPDYMSDAEWQNNLRMYPEDYPVDPRPARRRKPTAAVNQDLVDRLHGEFHDWWESGGHTLHPGADPERGPLGHWPHIEHFLWDRYPAAHLGLEMGMEEAGATLDGHPPKYLTNAEGQPSYETGPAAVATHGYDPAEIAASFVLLHNQSHPLRGDMLQRDQDRLTDIAQKRQQSLQDVVDRHEPIRGDMPQPDVDTLHGIAQTRHRQQQVYEQRNARLAMAWQDWAPHIQGGCKSCTHRDDGNGSHGEYWIKHEPTGDPLPGDALADGSLVSNLSFFHDVGRDGVPELYVAGIHTSSGHRNDGVAEALMRRMHEDHPNTRINPGFMTDDGQAFHDKMLDKEPDARGLLTTAGRNGDPPPMTMEPFGTKWSNGIMARHAEDGRPLGHLHWYDDGEIETVRVHPDFQRRGIATAMLRHANADPQTYEREPGAAIHHSNHLTNAGRAWASSDGHMLDDDEVEEANDDPRSWAWTAVRDYVPAHLPYTGQNEDEMKDNLYPEHPHLKVPYKLGGSSRHRWPTKWGGDHPDVPFDKRWGPNHPQHIPAPWDD